MKLNNNTYNNNKIQICRTFVVIVVDFLKVYLEALLLIIFFLVIHMPKKTTTITTIDQTDTYLEEQEI